MGVGDEEPEVAAWLNGSGRPLCLVFHFAFDVALDLRLPCYCDECKQDGDDVLPHSF